MEFKTSITIQKAGSDHSKKLNLPASEKEIKETIKELKIEENENFLTSDHESELDLNASDLSADNLKELLELNEIYKEFNELDEYEKEEAAAALEAEHGYLKDVIENVKKGNFIFYSEVEDETDLGRIYADEELPEHLRNYFDYEEYGYNCALDENGTFTQHGYICWA